MYAFHLHGTLLVVTGTNMDHKKSIGKMAKAIRRSPVIQALQLTALFV
jgi:hypothetical protein